MNTVRFVVSAFSHPSKDNIYSLIANMFVSSSRYFSHSFYRRAIADEAQGVLYGARRKTLAWRKLHKYFSVHNFNICRWKWWLNLYDSHWQRKVSCATTIEGQKNAARNYIKLLVYAKRIHYCWLQILPFASEISQQMCFFAFLRLQYELMGSNDETFQY